MIHPDTELRLIDDVIGHGVVATRFIPKGTLVWVLCQLDRRITPQEYLSFTPPHRDLIDKYAYVDSNGDFIYCHDNGRFINHSCDPSMVSFGSGAEIAVRDLHPGDALTCDYGVLNLIAPLRCLCGSPKCRGTIGAADVLAIAGELDEAYAPALASPPSEQPLLAYAANAAELQDWLGGRSRPESVTSFHFSAR